MKEVCKNDIKGHGLKSSSRSKGRKTFAHLIEVVCEGTCVALVKAHQMFAFHKNDTQAHREVVYPGLCVCLPSQLWMRLDMIKSLFRLRFTRDFEYWDWLLVHYAHFSIKQENRNVKRCRYDLPKSMQTGRARTTTAANWLVDQNLLSRLLLPSVD